MNSSQPLISRSEVECLTPQPITNLLFSRSFATSGEKSESPLIDDEGVHVRLGVAEVERVHDHADVGGVLAGLAHVRDLDQLEGGLVHRRA